MKRIYKWNMNPPINSSNPQDLQKRHKIVNKYITYKYIKEYINEYWNFSKSIWNAVLKEK